MDASQIQRRLAAPVETGDDAFSLVRSVAYFFQRADTDMVRALDLIIRLLDRREELQSKVGGLGIMIDSVAREAGLYPYVEGRSSWRDEVAIDLMRAPGLEDVIFHIEQALVFNKLSHGRSIILSAPTSFGKSLLIDALIALRRPSIVVAVVPTIALLDEFRRRMSSRFPDYQVITRSTEDRASERAIYVGTQERLLERQDLHTIDLFIIDEFYKLDLERSDQRSLALNTVLARFGRRSRQIYLLGPSIDEVPNIDRFRDDIEFVKTRYSPVTADIIDRTDLGPSPATLIEDLKLTGQSSSLIYVQSPPSAAKLTYEIINKDLYEGTEFCRELGDWLAESYHPEWILSTAVKQGIGIHHGRIPRSIAQLMISLFNDGDLKSIVCTSSMIEGVNTAAENVLIYDRKISTSKLDRFTFDNIKGRAGRMFRHKVGKVFLYSPPPDEADFRVRVPLFDADELMMPELLVQLDDESLTAVARRRKRAITDSSALPPETLKRWAEFGVDGLNSLAGQLDDELRTESSLLRWKGRPTFDELEATFSLPWTTLDFPKHDIRSARQLAFYAFRLLQSSSLRNYMDGLVRGTGLPAQREIDLAFNFLRGAEYIFPQVLLAMNDIIDVVSGEGKVNYRAFAAQLQNLFLPGELRALDEFGVPLPLLRRLSPLFDSGDLDGSRRLLAAPTLPIRAALSGFEATLLARGLG